jgi:hypothetical protein
MQHLYVSYPPADYAFAHRLVEDLQAAGYLVFVDAVSNVGTMAWAAETRQAIRAAGAILMIMSPEDGRRVGTRHEGVLALRRNKPIFALRRSPGDLPRYLLDAQEIDFCGDYARALAALLAALPQAPDLIAAPATITPRRPPRPQNSRRRRIVWTITIILALSACVAAVMLLGIL